MSQILIFGASITYGAWDVENGGWVQRLRSYIEIKNNKQDFIYNLGVPGDSTSNLLQRFENEAVARIESGEETIFIFCIGINDSAIIKNKQQATEPNDFKNNLVKLVTLAKKYSDKIIFIGLTQGEESKIAPVPWNNDFYYHNFRIEEYNKIIGNVCLENDLPFVDMIDLLNVGDLEDGLHPNAVGHEKIFYTVKDFLVKNKVI